MARLLSRQWNRLKGRRIREILAWKDEESEAVRHYILWLFPLPEPSLFNTGAPVLTEADIAAARLYRLTPDPAKQPSTRSAPPIANICASHESPAPPASSACP